MCDGAQRRSGDIIILLSATMWHHIRADEGVSAPRSASLPSSWREQQLIPARSGAARREPNSTGTGRLRSTDARSAAQPRLFRFEGFNQQLDSIREGRTRVLAVRSHAAAGFQARRGEGEKKRRKEKKGERSPGGFGVEHPTRLTPHTTALADVFYLSVPQFGVRGSHGCSDLPERVSEGSETFN